jgi:hypothetical protein
VQEFDTNRVKRRFNKSVKVLEIDWNMMNPNKLFGGEERF